MKKGNVILLVALTIAFGWNAYPSNDQKNAGGLRLSIPIESPNGVHFSWTGGQTGETYSIYRRMHGDTWWERISMNLSGISGAVDVPGFTLDKTYDYEIRADVP